MANIIVGIVLALIIAAAIVYIAKEKKKGTRCIGCPAGGCCSAKKHNGSGCGCHSES